MNVPKINGQSASEKHKLKAPEKEKIGNVPMIQDKKTLPPKEEAGWSDLGVDIKKGAIAAGKAMRKVIEQPIEETIEQAKDMNNLEHTARAAVGALPIYQVLESLPSPKLTPEEVIADEEKNLEMKGPDSYVKNFKGFLKPKADK